MDTFLNLFMLNKRSLLNTRLQHVLISAFASLQGAYWKSSICMPIIRPCTCKSDTS